MNEVEQIVANMTEEEKNYHIFNQPDSNVSKLIFKERGGKCLICGSEEDEEETEEWICQNCNDSNSEITDREIK